MRGLQPMRADDCADDADLVDQQSALQFGLKRALRNHSSLVGSIDVAPQVGIAVLGQPAHRRQPDLAGWTQRRSGAGIRSDVIPPTLLAPALCGRWRADANRAGLPARRWQARCFRQFRFRDRRDDAKRLGGPGAHRARRGLGDRRQAGKAGKVDRGEDGRDDLRPGKHEALDHRGAGLLGELQLPAFPRCPRTRSRCPVPRRSFSTPWRRAAKSPGPGLHQPGDPFGIEFDDVGLELLDPVDVGARRAVIVDGDAEAVGRSAWTKRTSAASEADFCSITSQTTRGGRSRRVASTARMSRNADPPARSREQRRIEVDEYRDVAGQAGAGVEQVERARHFSTFRRWCGGTAAKKICGGDLLGFAERPRQAFIGDQRKPITREREDRLERRPEDMRAKHPGEYAVVLPGNPGRAFQGRHTLFSVPSIGEGHQKIPW